MLLASQQSSALRLNAARRPAVCRKPALVCRAQQQQQQGLGQKLASAGAAAMLALSTLGGAPPAIASEFDILSEPTPTSNYYIDDAAVLSKSTRADINKRLKLVEINTGYRVEVVTVRKLEFETDPFAFADKVVETWYPEGAGKKGVLVVVTTSKEGGLSGGKEFIEAVGDDLIDSIVADNIPIFTEEEKYNASVITSVERLEAKLNGTAVPEGPKRNDASRERTYRTKEETEKSKSVTSTVVISLLIIAVVVPMLQYYGYTARD